MSVLTQLENFADFIKFILVDIDPSLTKDQEDALDDARKHLTKALCLVNQVAYGEHSGEEAVEAPNEQKHRVPREILVYPHFAIGTWTGLVKDAMGQVIEEENIESLSNIDATRDDVEQATVALAGRHGITIDSGYLHWDSHEHTAIWLAGDDESPHGWVCCQRGETDSIEDAKLGPIRLERSDAELDREVFGFTEVKFAYDGWLYETDVLEDESDGD